MAICLLDVNVLIALAWPSHEYNAAAHSWLAGQTSLGWATCPTTQCGFVRISSNPRAIAAAVKPVEAISLLERVQAYRGHRFWSDDLNLSDLEPKFRHSLQGHQQVTDAYLLALCQHKGGRLATFDAGIFSLASSVGASESVVIIPSKMSG